MSFTTPPNQSFGSGFTRCEPLITPKDMRVRYLFGMNLTDEQGNPMPDEVLQQQINAAVSWLEHSLDIIILQTRFLERYDYRQQDYTNFNFLQLKKRPISELISLKAKFPANRELVDYPSEWFVVEKEAAQIQLSPVEGSFSGLIITQGGSYVPLIYGVRSYWPHLFEVEYVAGFDADQIPAIINEVVGIQATIRTLEIMGELILGPGISSETVSLDGASASKQTTASAMFSAYSARIESYRKSLTEYTKAIKHYYNGIPSIIG